jgi:poly-gamma-glutamate synthesis protein (capsule biosynthesis protein)
VDCRRVVVRDEYRPPVLAPTVNDQRRALVGWPAVALFVALAVALLQPGLAAAREPVHRAQAGAAVRAPGAVAPGGRLPVQTVGLVLPAQIELLDRGRWRPVGRPIVRPDVPRLLRAPPHQQVLRLRARGADGGLTAPRRVRVRPLVLSAVGDVNFGDGPGAMIARFGPGYPWTSVGPLTSKADIAFANLECAVSLRGSPQPKKFVFRGRPGAVRAMSRRGGIDVVSLANNHAGDYGDTALLDTLRYLREAGIASFGAGASEQLAYRPRIIRRLGLRVAFVGFSTILPFEFRALGQNPGTAWGFPARVRSAVRRARRRADVVVAAFHWGTERATRESAAQRALAGVALRAGATAVIGSHPHVLQPIRRLPRRRLVAYSLGNFVFSASSPVTARTGVLELSLARRGVVGSRLKRATIRASRPVLDRG